ncbi:MAG TPA: hypothetical protein VH813_05835 [Candidatus Limnocylindrales bacterium]|jgi:hypothetical protein
MHKQVRVAPTASPADLERLLRQLAEVALEGDEILDPEHPFGVNIVAAGGSRIELGGRFAFAVDHRHQAAAERALEEGGYAGKYKVVTAAERTEDGRLRMEWLVDEPGALAEYVAWVRSDNGSKDRSIKDILVGVERDDQGRVPVQIFSSPDDGDDDDHDHDGGSEAS